MRLPEDVFSVLLVLVFAAGVRGYRDLRVMYERSSVTWQGAWPVVHKVAWPGWSTSVATCKIPAQFYSLTFAAALAEKEGKLGAVSWCRGASNMQAAAEAARFEALVDHMNRERRGGFGLSAPYVGVPLRIVVFLDLVLIDPRVKLSARPSFCEVIDPATGKRERLSFFSNITVEYEEPSRVTRQMQLLNKEACGMQFLINSF
jgi:hypothetical protein